MVRYFDKTDITPCPYGDVRRIVTGGEGVSNIHVVRVTQGSDHFHKEYDEVYYFLSGNGTITLDEHVYPVRPGAVVVIPAGTVHSLLSDSKNELEFIIFGIPPMSIEDDGARPIKP
jgi:mannose-6-phosphate isomerase-like protein (cupin superfamily)